MCYSVFKQHFLNSYIKIHCLDLSVLSDNCCHDTKLHIIRNKTFYNTHDTLMSNSNWLLISSMLINSNWLSVDKKTFHFKTLQSHIRKNQDINTWHLISFFYDRNSLFGFNLTSYLAKCHCIHINVKRRICNLNRSHNSINIKLL
jgi:hypothetical protein